MVRTRVITIVALVAAIASAALTLLSWIDLSHLGFPIRWNGLGMYVGEDAEHYGPMLSGMVDGAPGWIVLIASIAAAGALLAASRVRRLGLVACGCAVVAFGTAVVCVANPAVLVGGTKYEMGASGLADRDFVNSGALVAEAAATGVLVICTALIVVGARRRSEG
ncbi:hypothetical protein [Mycobacterium sp. 852002-40037_SCH5390672]|uniref:hypothetical protein n=1 Tax=Mycobacterium sp. 852002-40037_SCH5390672 TaxID=1834089 RepID=UPI0008049AC5|nr:hypothetical protein [Mycobacterium sp. 852002-40037_SCH5390672]OBB93941.1 hypothetical protein A5782_10665 [Mycobacterium sp. 852002-40037_SCH5390672]